MRHNDAAIEKGVLNALRHVCGFNIAKSTFNPVGDESYTFLITLNDDNQYFVKYCDKQDIIEFIDKINALLLQFRSFDFVVPPIEANGKTSLNVGHGKMSVYPYIKGSVLNMSNDKFDKKLVGTLTEILASIHSASPRVLVNLPKENFENDYTRRLEHILTDKGDDKLNSKAATLLENNEKLIHSIIEHHNQVASHYKQKKLDFVLTHGDVTGLNIIATNEVDIKLVDWDMAMLAPPERDLNFLFDNPNFSLDKYMQLSGNKHFDLQMREYYGEHWALDCIIESFESLLSGSKNKADDSEYLIEIEEYLSYYK